MSDIINKLKQPPPPLMVPGCSTCRHKRDDPNLKHSAEFWKCGAVGGRYAQYVYRDTCHGNLWEPEPPRVPALVRLKRWLVG